MLPQFPRIDSNLQVRKVRAALFNVVFKHLNVYSYWYLNILTHHHLVRFVQVMTFGGLPGHQNIPFSLLRGPKSGDSSTI